MQNRAHWRNLGQINLFSAKIKKENAYTYEILLCCWQQWLRTTSNVNIMRLSSFVTTSFGRSASTFGENYIFFSTVILSCCSASRLIR